MGIQITENKTAAVQVIQRGLALGLRSVDACGNGAARGRNHAFSGMHLRGIGIPQSPLMNVVLALGHEVIGSGPRRQIVAMKIHHAFHFIRNFVEYGDFVFRLHKRSL